MSLADELLADLEDDNDDGELEELVKIKVESDEDGNFIFFLLNIFLISIFFRSP